MKIKNEKYHTANIQSLKGICLLSCVTQIQIIINKSVLICPSSFPSLWSSVQMAY